MVLLVVFAVTWCVLNTASSWKMADGGGKVVCYYSPSLRVPVSTIPPDICTHIVFAFAEVGVDTIVPSRTTDVTQYKALVALKQRNPPLKVLLSLQKGFEKMVQMGTQAMQTFSANAVKFLRLYGFDGVDFDWEFPGSSEKESYMEFLSIFRDTIDKEKETDGLPSLLVSMALGASPAVAKRSYNVPSLNQYIDFATIMTYDFHMFIRDVDNVTGYNSPLFAPRGERSYWSAAGAIINYISLGMDRSKILLGVAAYGRSYTLANLANHGLHAPAVGKGPPGPVIHKAGLVIQTEICMQLKDATRMFDSTSGVPYYYSGTTWVSYDDQESVTGKCKWVLDNALAGVGVWALNLDDVSGQCGSTPLPLIRTMKEILAQ